MLEMTIRNLNLLDNYVGQMYKETSDYFTIQII